MGKIGISDDILRKAGPLTDEEKLMMHKHPLIGEGIIKPVRSLSRLCGILRSHHEWYDGCGYPDGLKAEAIPMGARILTVTDAFDAMVTDRPYRKGFTVDEAKAELKKYSGQRYDPQVVDAFLRISL